VTAIVITKGMAKRIFWG